MAILDIRQRSGYLFLAVMVGHILLISTQVNSRTGVPIIEAVTFGAFSEVQRGISAGVSGLGHVWGDYVALQRVKRENDYLRRQLEATQVEVQAQRTLADRARSLQQLLELRDRSNLRTVAAEIIAAGGSPDFRTVTIDRGSRDDVHANMAIISPAGVVGRVVVPSAHASKVQLLVDRNAAVGALVERSRAQGVVTGGGDNRLRLEFVSEVSDIAVGDRVVTSGIDGIFPKGYPIGRVESVERSGGGYKRIVIAPAVDFSSIEDVLVVLTPPGGEAADGSSE